MLNDPNTVQLKLEILLGRIASSREPSHSGVCLCCWTGGLVGSDDAGVSGVDEGNGAEL